MKKSAAKAADDVTDGKQNFQQPNSVSNCLFRPGSKSGFGRMNHFEHWWMHPMVFQTIKAAYFSTPRPSLTCETRKMNLFLQKFFWEPAKRRLRPWLWFCCWRCCCLGHWRWPSCARSSSWARPPKTGQNGGRVRLTGPRSLRSGCRVLYKISKIMTFQWWHLPAYSKSKSPYRTS